MWVYQDQALLHEHIISTGIPDSPTLPGIFQVSSHYENAYASIWDLYMPHFMGIYDAVPGLTNGIHGLPLLSNGHRLWADVLGRPASFGCIILDLGAAEELFSWAEDGVVVVIQG
jgi:lipoprotein-anchoring transpeptidase ErfK/SrfK